MATSDDEMEDLPESVTNYYFVDDAEEPISFSVLPINWNTSEAVQGSGKQIYVRGNADAGLDKIFKPVRAWKFDISGVKPEISVLSKDNNWIKLQKPRQSFEEYIRTVLITVNFLHLVKRNPDFPGNRIWKKLSEIFGLYDVIPSSKDLRSHRVLIEQAVKQDESLKKSKYLLTVLERNQQKRHQAEEDDLVKGKSEFVVNDDESSDEFEEDSGDGVDGSGGEDGSADEEDDDEEPFDSVCSICDEGGPLLCCDGNCLRSFHATVKAGKPSQCSSLGFTEAEVKAMPYFKCQNCQYKLHQCYACGQLGSSDKQIGAKVFQCVNATCGFFYHPHCVAKRLIRNNEDSCKALAEKIQAGESFTCPLHTCIVCKQAEDKTDPELQMAVCRRCPKAYHKKCLPKEISFGEDEDEGMVQRAWEGLLVDRILIYCLKHEIDDDLGTPARNHIKFSRDVKEKEPSARVLKESKIAPKNKSSSLKERSQAPLVLESKKKNIEDSDPDKKNDRRVPKLQTKVPLEKKSGLTKIGGSSGAEERKCLQQLDVTKPSQIEKHDESESAGTNKAAVKKSVPQLDSDSERRILDLMKEVSSIITLDDIIGKHEKLIPSRAYKQKMDPCKNITEGKVQNLCVAISDVLRKIDRGSSFEEAKGACGPSDLNQLVKWKSKLRVYLAPFLYGMRYTSFGRHFTKIDRLKEIADTLHWYVNDDDTIVDFCCGSNDFSLLMKENLESRGKKCNYKNYDLFPPKKDFCFETRDWMTVQPSELPTGSKLIMGLNPPFGVRACKANQFIDKALQFKPKLIILIVPPETERLDKKKKSPYDLVWEYKDKLSGKSFYLPGSVDTNDKQMEDWNVVTPALYLWSRPDWTTKHMEIAKKHNHLLDEQRQKHNTNRLSRDLSFKDHGQSSIAMKTDDASPQTQLPEGPKEKAVGGNENLEKQSAHKDHNIGKQANAAPAKGKKKKNSKKKRRNEGIHIEDFKRRRFSPGNPQPEVSYRSPHNSRDGRETGNLRHHVGSPSNFEPSPYAERRFSVENRPPRYHKSPSNGDLVHDHHLPGATGYGTANYYSPYYNDGTVNFHPIEQKIWPMDQGPVADYGPHRNPVDSRLGYMRPDLHNYGFSHSYSTVEQPYETEAYATEISGYDRRANHNPMSAMDKYKLRLDGPSSVRPGVGGYIPDVPHPPGVVFYDHHQAQAQRQVYPGGPMSFAPGPPNHYHHHTSSGGWIDE